MTEPWLAQAWAAIRQHNWTAAEALLKPVVEHPAALHLLGLMRKAQGRWVEALELWEQALTQGAVSELYLELARTYFEAGQWPQAYDRYQQALAESLPLLDSDRHQLARSAYLSGKAAEALPIYQALLKLYPAQSSLWLDLGNALLALSQPLKAKEAYQRSLELAPDSALAYYSLAHLAWLQGESAQTERLLKQALAWDPRLVAAWNLQGSLLQAAGKLQDALLAFEQAVQIDFRDASSWNNLGLCYQAAYQGKAAEDAYLQALSLEPGLLEARLNLARLQRERNLPDAALAQLELLEQDLKVAEQHFGALPYLKAFVLPVILAQPSEASRWLAHLEQGLQQLLNQPVSLRDPLQELGSLPFYLPYLAGPGQERALLETLAVSFRQACPRLSWQAPHTLQPRRPGRWRIGLASAHFYQHTILHLFGYLFEQLDPERFELIALLLAKQEDSLTAQVRQQAAAFVRLPQELQAAQEQIAGLELDLLLYLDVALEPMSYFLAFGRLARVQWLTWGHPLTSGLDSLDGFLSSRGQDAEPAQQAYSEKLIELPEFFGCWRPVRGSAKSRVELGLPEGRLYLCPQSLFKLQPEMDTLFAGILRRDPEGWLVLIEGLYPEWRQTLQQRWAAQLDLNRLIWLPRLSQPDFLAVLEQGQVMLETRPFGGGLTILQAFAAGTPVVSWPEAALKGRLAKVIADSLDWQQGIVEGADAYAERAVELAKSWDSESRLDLQRRYREKIRADKMAADVSEAMLEVLRKFEV